MRISRVVALAALGALIVTVVERRGSERRRSTPDFRSFRVCADPNNLPFSNRTGEGFENRLAELIARDLRRTVEYTWWPQRRGFIRNTLRAEKCDVVMGVPASFELVAVTRPYYRSSYVFVTRTPRGLDVRSLDDPRLRDLRIGVQLVGDDYANTPPVHALARRGITGNLRGYLVYGDYGDAIPGRRIIDAVRNGEVDVAIVWGPLAGFLAREGGGDLRIANVSPAIDPPFVPFVYDIAVGVRREDETLRRDIDRVLLARAAEIRALLNEYGVPTADGRVVADAR